MSSHTDIAVLAPVWEEFLDSAKEICETEGYVAFGTRADDAAQEIERVRAGNPIPILIYPSHQDGECLRSFAEWIGVWSELVEALPDGTHPEGERHRPADSSGQKIDKDWAHYYFWHVTHLEKLKDGHALSKCRSQRSRKSLTAVPRYPLLVERPHMADEWMKRKVDS